MTMATYHIYSGSEEVTNATGYPLADEDEAMRLAQEISNGQPGSTVTVRSSVREPMAEWTQIVGRFVDGKPSPWLWDVTFLGALRQGDDARLNEPPIAYMGAGSEPIPGGIRAGLSRHRLTVEAGAGAEAVEIVRMALGAQAADMHDWTYEPGER